MEKEFCKNHPEIEAKWKCESCNNCFCDECIKIQRISNMDFQICRLCGGKCNCLAKDQSLPVEENPASFFDQLSSVFAYPFKSGSTERLIIGIVFFAILNFVAYFSLFGLFIALFVAGYLFAWVMSIIHTTAIGEDTLADWPDFRDFWGDVIHPFFLLIGTTFFCQLPALLCFISSFFIPAAAIILLPLSILFGILGSIYFPMGLLAVVICGTITALDPRIIIPSIAKTAASYIVICLLFVALMGMNSLGRVLGGFMPIVGPLIAYAISFYLMVVQARVLGLLYRTNDKKLGWTDLE